MTKRELVMVAWNHWRNGCFRGVLTGASCDVLHLESPYWNAGIKAEIEGSCVVLGGKRAERFEIIGHREWVGNWCWDGLTMKRSEAVRMMNWLLKKGFRLDSAEESVWNKIERGETLVESDLIA